MTSSLGDSRVGDLCCMQGVLSVEVKAKGRSEQAEELLALAWGKWQLRVELVRQSAQRTLARCCHLPHASPVVGDETIDDGR
jgi:hypothetical protein